MNKRRYLPPLFGLPLLFATGCTTVIRENIISSVNTGIGIEVVENPKTELYEVKVGYIRSQFYSIPTGKMVKGVTNNSADITPELVSGIKMHSGIEHLLVGMDVSENFAVGKIAVMSPAAVAMYIAEAKSPEASVAASEAVKGLASPAEMKVQAANIDLQTDILNQIGASYAGANATKRAAILAKAKEQKLVHDSTTEEKLMNRLGAAADEKPTTTDKLNEVLKEAKR